MTQVYLAPNHEAALEAIAMDVHFSFPDSGDKEQFEAIREFWFTLGPAGNIDDENIHHAMQQARRTF